MDVNINTNKQDRIHHKTRLLHRETQIKEEKKNMCMVYLSFISQGHNLYKLQYISLEEVKIVSFQQ